VKDASTLKEGSAVTEQSQPEWRAMGDDEEVGIWAIVSRGGLGAAGRWPPVRGDRAR
jgi:hypothetical protein